MNKKTILVNLFAGPGSGKSTTMAGVFSILKLRGINCEMAPEFAKEKVWENSIDVLKNQIYVFGKQLHTVHRLIGKVDVIITDSPLLLSIIYGKNEGKTFNKLILEKFNSFDTINFFINRKKVYNPSGRLQTESEAKAIDKTIKNLLNSYKIEYTKIDASPSGFIKIANEISKHIKEVKND